MKDVESIERAPPNNVDQATSLGFGDEWSRFDQSALSDAARRHIFDEYFGIFPQQALNLSAVGADFGVGSGRWAAVIAPQVKHLICIDASHEALNIAKKNLKSYKNCSFQHCTVNEADIQAGSLDFAYSLGVLHHIPDTRAALKACVEKLKPGAPLLIYLYYRFDNKPAWFRFIWSATDICRRLTSKLPYGPRYWVSQLLAGTLYWPLARISRVLERFGISTTNLPLSYYRDKPFYVMRNDALDRFGTRLEQRFTRAEIKQMMSDCDLTDIEFSPAPPFWCAVGFRRAA